MKLADKICNVTDILNDPPAEWSDNRKLEYILWVEKIIQVLKGANLLLEKHLTRLIQRGIRTFKI